MIDSFRFSVDLMDEWIGETGIGLKPKRGKRLLSIYYDKVEETSVELANGMSLKISCSWELDGFPWISEISVKQKMYFELIGHEAAQFEFFKNIARRVTTFLIFATSKSVCINYAEGLRDSVSLRGRKKSKNRQVVSLFFDDMYHVPDVPRFRKDDSLFSFKDISNFSEVINSWISLYDDMEDILNLYFSVGVGGQRFLEGRFLSLAQVVEAYHGRVMKGKVMDSGEYDILIKTIVDACPPCHASFVQSKLKYGNELSFYRKVIALMSHFGSAFGTMKDIKKMARSIVNARNYYTHYSIALKSEVVPGDELMRMCSVLDVLFAMHVMQKMHLPDSIVGSAKYIRMK